MTNNLINYPILGAMLAGGASRRMHGIDKRLLALKGSTLLDLAISRAYPQVSKLLVCTHNDAPKISTPNLQIVQDVSEQYLGPAAGLVSAITWAEAQGIEFEWLMSFACDTPNFPLDLVDQLVRQAISTKSQVCVPLLNGRSQYTFGLWHRDTTVKIRQVFAEGQYALKHIIQFFETSLVEYQGHETSFFNINSRQDWEAFVQHQTSE